MKDAMAGKGRAQAMPKPAGPLRQPGRMLLWVLICFFLSGATGLSATSRPMWGYYGVRMARRRSRANGIWDGLNSGLSAKCRTIAV